MKLFLLCVASITTATLFAQPKLYSKAIITTTTNVIAPEEEDVSQVGQGQGQGGMNFRTMLDGEIKSTTQIKNDLVKTNLKSETMKASVYRNNSTKTTTTIYEIMGNTQGMVSNDSDDVIMKKKADSMMAERAKTDTNMKRRTRNVDFTSTVSYTEETKKIAGYTCKKAYIITDKLLKKDTSMVWYCPEFKFANVPSTGGMSGLPMARMFSSGGGDNFDKVNGFVMMYEKKMPRGRTMEVKVTKVELDKEVADKEFEIPKDVEIKSMKDIMGGRGGGNVQIISR